MSSLSAKWQQAAEKYAALSRRERAIVAAALLLGGGFLVFNFGVDPFLQKARAATKAELAARADLAQQRVLLTLLQQQNADPDAANRNRLMQAKQELTAAGERLASFESGMVSPQRMRAFLEGLLAQNKSIELLGLTTLPVTLVGAAEAAGSPEAVAAPAAKGGKEKAAPAPDEGIYQHGIEIKLAGTYNDLLNYLAELERMPQRVMWNSVSLTVEKHPRNIMVLRVYTLSLDRSWLAV